MHHPDAGPRSVSAYNQQRGQGLQWPCQLLSTPSAFKLRMLPSLSGVAAAAAILCVRSGCRSLQLGRLKLDQSICKV